MPIELQEEDAPLGVPVPRVRRSEGVRCRGASHVSPRGDRWSAGDPPMCLLFLELEMEMEYSHVDFERWQFVEVDGFIFRDSLKHDIAPSL